MVGTRNETHKECGSLVREALRQLLVKFKLTKIKAKDKWFKLTLFSVHTPTREIADTAKGAFYKQLKIII